MGIIVCYAKPMVVNHCAMLSGCVGIMVCCSEPVIWNHGVNAVAVGVNNGELCCASGVELCFVILCQ